MDDTSTTAPLALIIEDDAKLSVIYTEAVTQAGFTTFPVLDGERALQALDILQPALVILDLRLPRVSGEKILTAIRTDPRLVKTKVILTTADTVTARMLEEESDLVLVKPISFTQLRDLACRLAVM